ncbi:MAG: hypothetical protein ACOH17_12490 [Cellulomonas sp.]
MSWKSRTSIGVLTATVLTGAGVATMANALAAAQPPAPAVSVSPAAPIVVDTQLPADRGRTEELARSVDELLAQIHVLEQAVATGAGTPTATPGPTPQPGRHTATGGVTTGVEPTATHPQDERASTEHPSKSPDAGKSPDPAKSPEPGESSDD